MREGGEKGGNDNRYSGILAYAVHSINVSLVSIQLPESMLFGIGIILWEDVTGNCIFEEVEVTGFYSNSTAIVMYPRTS